MPLPFDSAAVRNWCTLALDALRRGRGEIDAINVFPVADGDTGTNLHRTLDSAARALAPLGDGPAGPALGALARGALLGACGNSGTILAQLLRGVADVFAGGAPEPEGRADGEGALLARALRRAAESAYEAVARPVEGTMLTVARAAADAADAAVSVTASAASAGRDAAGVARAAYEGAREALAATTGQLDVLRRAGVVDAGALGLVAVLGALADALDGPAAPARSEREEREEREEPGEPEESEERAAEDARRGRTDPARTGTGDTDTARTDSGAGARTGSESRAGAAGEGASGEETEGASGDGTGGEGPAFEVMYLLDGVPAPGDAAVRALRARLDGLGDSVVIGGGEGLWSVHVHTDDAGAAVEAGIETGRPHRVSITGLSRKPAASPERGPAAEEGGEGGPGGRAVVAVVAGEGLAALYEEAGAAVLRAAVAGEVPGGPGGLTAAIRATGAAEIVLLPNDPALHERAHQAARAARKDRRRVAVVPTESAVQGLAALAVHEGLSGFERDTEAMKAAAAATRYAVVTPASRAAATAAGPCAEGDALGLVAGEVAVVGGDFARTAVSTAVEVLELMLASGGELVTLVPGPAAPGDLAERIGEHLRRAHPALDTVVHGGGRGAPALLIGIE